MFKKQILKFFVLFLVSLFLFSATARAKVLPQARGSVGKSGSVSKNVGASIGVSPYLRGDRRALMINFSNLQNASFVSYLLTYKQNGQEEGAMGSLSLSGSSSTTSELLFGTCSKNVCRYHTGIKNAKLEISYTSKSGKKYLRRYRIKV